jgi:DNA-binding MurR/RpiR family transcriptional regulator
MRVQPENVAPTSVEAFREQLLKRYDELSKRLQQIARYVLDEPNEVALETLAVIAQRCGVQPSAIVRFAQSFAFSGATQMQRLFRDGLLSNDAGLGYGERVRRFNEALIGAPAADGLLSEFVDGTVLALQNLRQTVTEEEIRAAVDLIDKADLIHVAGFRRAFPVSSYLAYSLQQLGKRVLFMDGVAGLAKPQANTIRPGDLLIAASYHPYAAEAVEVVGIAASKGAKILSISDSHVSPIAKAASVVLQVRDSETRGFRSLAASMCLAQALVLGFAFNHDREGGKGRKKPK